MWLSRGQQILLPFLSTRLSTIGCVSFCPTLFIYLLTSSGHPTSSKHLFTQNTPKWITSRNLVLTNVTKLERKIGSLRTDAMVHMKSWYLVRNAGKVGGGAREGSQAPSHRAAPLGGLKWLSYRSIGECVTDTQRHNSEPNLSGLKLSMLYLSLLAQKIGSWQQMKPVFQICCAWDN